MQLSPNLEKFLNDNNISNLDDLRPLLISADMKKWLDDRRISNLNELQKFMMISFLGSITNHNIRETKIDLAERQLSKMNEYFRMSVFDVDDENHPQKCWDMYQYQLGQFEDWRALHSEYESEFDDITIDGKYPLN